MFAPYGDRLGAGQTVVYDCMDELANFAGAPAGLIGAEDQLLERADLVFTGGRSLFESKRDRNPNVHCFPSAVDAAHFARASGRPTSVAVPADLAGLPRPRSSAITGWSTSGLDYDLDRPNWSTSPGVGSVVLVGPLIKVDPADACRRWSNLHYLGQALL